MKCISKLVLSMMLGMIVLFGSSIKDHYYRAEIGDSVVRVLNAEMTGGGTGFHIKTNKGKVYILTNRHVCGVADADGIVVIEHQGNHYSRQIFKKYEHHDLCLIDAISQNSPAISIASNAEKGEDVIVVGHPGLRNLTLSHGEFIGKQIIQLATLVDDPKDCKGDIGFDPFANKYICGEDYISSAITAPIYGGNSGSPVINKWGHIVGVVFAGNRSQVHDSYMVPLSYVKDFLKGL